MQSSKDQQGKIRKLPKVNNAKKQRKTTEWERLEIFSRKLKKQKKTKQKKQNKKKIINMNLKKKKKENQKYKGNISCKDENNKGQKRYGPNRTDFKKRWQEYTEEP